MKPVHVDGAVKVGKGPQICRCGTRHVGGFGTSGQVLILLAPQVSALGSYIAEFERQTTAEVTFDGQIVALQVARLSVHVEAGAGVRATNGQPVRRKRVLQRDQVGPARVPDYALGMDRSNR